MGRHACEDVTEGGKGAASKRRRREERTLSAMAAAAGAETFGSSGHTSLAKMAKAARDNARDMRLAAIGLPPQPWSMETRRPGLVRRIECQAARNRVKARRAAAAAERGLKA